MKETPRGACDKTTKIYKHTHTPEINSFDMMSFNSGDRLRGGLAIKQREAGRIKKKKKKEKLVYTGKKREELILSD